MGRHIRTPPIGVHQASGLASTTHGNLMMAKPGASPAPHVGFTSVGSWLTESRCLGLPARTHS